MSILSINLELGEAKVTSDEFNYIVHVKKVKGAKAGDKAGEMYWVVNSYHGSLTQVANRLAQLAATGYDIADTKVFDKITSLLDGEAHRLLKQLEKKAK